MKSELFSLKLKKNQGLKLNESVWLRFMVALWKVTQYFLIINSFFFTNKNIKFKTSVFIVVRQDPRYTSFD